MVRFWISFGQLGPNLVSLAATVSLPDQPSTVILGFCPTELSSSPRAIMSQEVLWVLATLIKDIKHIYHHGKDDGDHADIDGECVLA